MSKSKKTSCAFGSTELSNIMKNKEMLKTKPNSWKLEENEKQLNKIIPQKDQYSAEICIRGFDGIRDDEETKSFTLGRSLRSRSSSVDVPPYCIIDERSSGNSCASSSCNSPKGDGKTPLRSTSQLSSTREQKTVTKNTTQRRLSRKDFKNDNNDKISPIENSRSSFEMSRPAVKETRATHSKNEKVNVEIQSTERKLRPRLSEIQPTEACKENINFATGRRITGTTPNFKNLRSNNNSKKSLNPNDPTHAFFESMAMTVNSFPQHVQATIKKEVCNIVAETEYKLFFPRDEQD